MDDGRFGLDFPVYYLVSAESPAADPGAGPRPVAPARYLIMRVDGDPCLPVFTDRDLADRFRPPLAGGIAVVAADSPAVLAAVLRDGVVGVVTHVAFDPPDREGAHAACVVPVMEVALACAAAAGRAGG